MAEISYGNAGTGNAPRAGKLVNYAGAVMSLALVVGVGVWGYKLLVRDVTGVPVVRAMEGPMRSAPENPGGEIALHTGLSVNTVPAQGGVAPPEDTLVLAPAQPALPQEDLEVTPTAEAAEIMPQDPLGTVAEGEVAAVAEAAETAAPVDPDTPLTVEDVLALADQIAAGAAPMTDLEEGEDTPVEVAVAGVVQAETPAPQAPLVAASVPGVARSLRPQLRPRGGFAPAVVTPAVAPASAPAEVNEAVIPAGTKLVQLGAFDSAEIAAREWTRLSGEFNDYMDGKDRLIQRAESGGRTFYRLRAMGFADLADARRFCSALVAEDAACIPVVVR